MSRLLNFVTKCFKFFKKKVGYILWGIAVGAKREQRELRPERMGQPRGHGQVRPQVRPRLRPWQQPNRFSFFELPKKNHGPYSNVTMLSVAFFLLELQKIIHTCTLDVLWGQPIKLIQVASNSELLEIVPSREQWEGTISKKRRLFHWFSRNSELKATWISLIGWPN